MSALRGDETALFERHSERLRRSVARALGGDRAHADDACAFAWAQLCAHQPERTERIFAWLRTTALREGRRLLSRERDEAAPVSDAEQDDRPWEEAVPAPQTLEDELEGRSAAQILTDLRPREARYVALSAAGYSYAEIGKREGATYTNVNKHLTRLRPGLGRCGPRVASTSPRRAKIPKMARRGILD